MKKDDFFNFKAKVGDAVIYRLNGKWCMRSLPERPTPMPTPMLEQQERIKAIASLYRSMVAAGLDGAWKQARKPAGWSAYNLFLQKNLPALTKQGTVGDFKKLMLTVGAITLPDNIRLIQEETPGKWLLEWTNETLYPHCCPDDRIKAVIMQGNGRNFTIKPVAVAEGNRETGQASITVPEQWQGWRYLYCFMLSSEGIHSPSVCIEMTKD